MEIWTVENYKMDSRYPAAHADSLKIATDSNHLTQVKQSPMGARVTLGTPNGRIVSLYEPSNPLIEADTSPQTKKIKSKKKKRNNKSAPSRGMETLLRSSYRTQLDLIKVADTKASIMISITSLIVSVLLATGGAMVLFSEKTIFVTPIIMLLISGFVSLFFAVMSARPSIARGTTKMQDDFLTGNANVMFFEDIAGVAKDKYVTVMREIMKNRDQIYEEMFKHIHGMSVVLKKKFYLLRIAYSVFIIGLCLCIATFIGIVTIEEADEAEASISATIPIESSAYHHFSQPSGIFNFLKR